MFFSLCYRLLFLSFLIGIEFTLPPFSYCAGPEKSVSNLTILIYHKFGESNYPTTNVPLGRFDEQMAFLRDNKIPVLPLAKAVEMLQKDQAFPEKAAVITIDDAYKSTYRDAWPILKKYGFPFTVFLYGKAIEKRYSNYLTWDQIREMQKAGVDFQDHGYSHRRLAGRPDGMNGKEYVKWVVDDLKKSRALLTKNLGVAPRFLAYPYGEYNTIVRDVVKSLGYEAAFSQDPSSASQFVDFYAIPREPILGDEWISMKHFKKILNRVDLPVTAFSPDDKPFEDTKPAEFCASTVYPDLYRPGTIGIYVSELGWQPAIRDGNNYCIPNTKKLTRRSNRVAISGREKGSGREAIHYWLLVNPFMSQ